MFVEVFVSSASVPASVTFLTPAVLLHDPFYGILFKILNMLVVCDSSS